MLIQFYKLELSESAGHSDRDNIPICTGWFWTVIRRWRMTGDSCHQIKRWCKGENVRVGVKEDQTS